MTVQVQLLSAFIRKADVAAHYRGGCEAFEEQHTLGTGDAYLYQLVSMSGEELETRIHNIDGYGFDTEMFVAIADMWAGPFKRTPNIFFKQVDNNFPPTWVAASTEEHRHV